MKVIKTIGNCCLVFLAILSVCISLAYAYVCFFDNDFTTGTNYVDNQVPIDLIEKSEDLTQNEIDYYESRYLFNVNYYSKGTPDLYLAIHQNIDGVYGSDAAILAKLQEASFIWAKGKYPSSSQEVADWVASRYY